MCLPTALFLWVFRGTLRFPNALLLLPIGLVAIFVLNAARIAEIEKARHTFIVPSGQSAIALIYLVYCRAGSHALVPESAYGNSREIADDLLAKIEKLAA